MSNDHNNDAELTEEDKKRLSALIIVQTGTSRFIGLWAETDDTGSLRLEQATAVAARQTLHPLTGAPINAPTLATMDYNTKYIPSILIRNWNWMYMIKDLDEDTQLAFMTAYEGFRRQLEVPIEEMLRREQEDHHRIQAVPGGAINALDALAKSGRLPPGIGTNIVSRREK